MLSSHLYMLSYDGAVRTSILPCSMGSYHILICRLGKRSDKSAGDDNHGSEESGSVFPKGQDELV